MLAGHILGFVIFYSLGGCLFLLNIYLKEELSFKTKEGYEEYDKRSLMFGVRLTEQKWSDYWLYSLLVGGVLFWYSLQMAPLFFYPFNKLD